MLNKDNFFNALTRFNLTNKMKLNKTNTVYVEYNQRAKAFTVKGNGEIEKDYWYNFQTLLDDFFNNVDYVLLKEVDYYATR